jgi:hypothetical protein
MLPLFSHFIMCHSVQGRMIDGTKVPFQAAPMELETLNQPVGNNECGFCVMWAMLRYLGVKLEPADALVCHYYRKSIHHWDFHQRF